MAIALLVIDLQNSLLDEGPWRADTLLANTHRLIDAARAAAAPVIFMRDTRVAPDGALHSGLNRAPDDAVIDKDFCDAFLDTPLHARLQAAGVTDLVVCGLQSDYCIDTSCRRAAALGYRVLLAADAHSTFDHDDLPAARIIAHHNHILRNFAAAAGHVRSRPVDRIRFHDGDPQ